MIPFKFNGKDFELNTDIVDDWYEIQTQILIQREKQKAIKRKLSQDIIQHRKTIIELLSFTDEKLTDIIQENESSIDYSNSGMLKATTPFKRK